MPLTHDLKTRLSDIEAALGQLSPALFAPAVAGVDGVAVWLRERFLPREREILESSGVLWSKEYVAKMLAAAQRFIPELQPVAALVSTYCRSIDEDIQGERPAIDAGVDAAGLLDAIERELRALGYWSEHPISRFDLEDPRFLFPDRSLQFIFLPAERARVATGARGFGDPAGLRGVQLDLSDIPKARQLIRLLERYRRDASGPTHDAEALELTPARPTETWLVELEASTVDGLFARGYEAMRTRVRLAGHKRGEAPISALRERFEATVAQDVVAHLTRELTESPPALAADVRVLCAIERVQEHQPLRLLVRSRGDLLVLLPGLPGARLSRL